MEVAQKIIIALIIISLLGGGIFVLFANQTKAASAFLYFLKEFIIKPLVRQLANALENKLVNSINGLVSGLSQKIPSFILNWRNYALDSQARGNDVFRSVLADAKLCPYFQGSLRTAFGADRYLGALAGSTVKVGGVPVYQNKTSVPGLPSFQELTNCTLPPSLNSVAAINAYKNDFSKGGWTAWNQLVQPQNNFFGTYALSLNEQGNQMDTEKQSARDEAIAGKGFLSQRLPATGSASPTGCTGAFGPPGSGRCVFMGKVVTPADLLGQTTAQFLDKKMGRVGGSTELTDVILNMLNAVVSGLSSRILNFIGLNSYSVPPNGGAGFNETPQDVAPGGPGDPAVVCANACSQEEQDCLSKVSTVCTPGPIDPNTGLPGPDVCGPDPVAQANCNSAAVSCRNSCRGLQ